MTYICDYCDKHFMVEQECAEHEGVCRINYIRDVLFKHGYKTVNTCANCKYHTVDSVKAVRDGIVIYHCSRHKDVAVDSNSKCDLHEKEDEE